MSNGPASHDPQKAVNDMALAIAKAEMETERLMVTLGKLPRDVRDFRKGCSLDPCATAEAQARAAGALAAIGEGYRQLRIAHDELEDVRKRCNLPEPGPVVTGGGGGGKVWRIPAWELREPNEVTA